MSRPLRIWIDIAAPPQVLFFRPIVEALHGAGHRCLVTIRDFSRAPQIATQLGMAHVVVGRHGGQGTAAKGVAMLARVRDLIRIARQFAPDLAASHNSYAQALAAAVLRVPLVTAMDYEHQPANHLSFRLATRVLVPEAFPEDALRRCGAHGDAVVRYSGVKEEVYLADFAPDRSFPSTFGLPPEQIIVTMRPPARSALYHRFENPLFEAALDRISAVSAATILLLDRGSDPRWTRFPNVRVVQTAVDGPNVVYWSDLVVGGGGTMNREAAVLGTPAYSVFAGKPIAVDDYLIQQGRLTRIESAADLDRIAIRKRLANQPHARSAGLQQILAVLTGPW